MATINGEPFLVIICVGSSWDDDVLSSQVFTVGFWFLITDAHIFVMLMWEDVEACYTKAVTAGSQHLILLLDAERLTGAVDTEHVP